MLFSSKILATVVFMGFVLMRKRQYEAGKRSLSFFG